MSNSSPNVANRDAAPLCSKLRQRDRQPCRAKAVRGTDPPVCRRHAGKRLSTVRAEVRVREEATRWGLGDETVDPGVVMMRLVSQAVARVGLYSDLLRQAYDAADRLRRAHDAEELVMSQADPDPDGPEDPAVQAARHDLRRIFSSGGVAALIGYKFDADRDGRIYATEEAVRGLAKLESEERDRCASFAAKGVAAGLAERQVRLWERQGALMAAVFRRSLDDADLLPQVRLRIEAAFDHHMSRVADEGMPDGELA